MTKVLMKDADSVNRRTKGKARAGRMSIEATIALIAAAIGLFILAWVAYAFLKEGLTIVEIGGLLAIAAVVAGTVFILTPTAEERLARKLEVEEGTQRMTGKVLVFNRGGGSDSETRVELTVSLDIDGVAHTARMKTQIEDALLANFATGKPIHLLYDPNDLSRIAIDRKASPTTVE